MEDRLHPIFRPRSIAVIGASRTQGKIGHTLMKNLIVNEFQGKLFPVNPKADSVWGVKAYPTILDVPDPVDLAIITIPAEIALGAVEQCAAKGVKGLVVITAGFREIGPAGEAREDRLRETCRAHGIALVGPNCMGVINTHPDVRMDATFAPTPPLRGPVSFLSQSGALGVAILEHARNLNLGFSMFASLGNKADVSGNDLLEAWEKDPDTKVVLMYLENFGNPKNFVRIARRVTKRKPVVAVKAGRTEAGGGGPPGPTRVPRRERHRRGGRVHPDRRAPRGLDRGAVRRRDGVLEAAPAEGEAGRDRERRGGARDHVHGLPDPARDGARDALAGDGRGDAPARAPGVDPEEPDGPHRRGGRGGGPPGRGARDEGPERGRRDRNLRPARSHGGDRGREGDRGGLAGLGQDAPVQLPRAERELAGLRPPR